mmetsp:Transcript_135155/g.252684  ORF Transcript_135155/g.252684 Transcript_135155/m.252684 type:complete len:92 (-) Transcript_135155:17-292(-)
MGRKQYNFRLVDEATNDRLSGYPHNAVTPLAMAADMPVVISDKILELADGTFWLGGGHVDLKMRVEAKNFVEIFAAASADITAAEGENEEA